MASYRFNWNLPYELDPDESEITVEFDASPGERQTHDYPGSPAVVEIERVLKDGREYTALTSELLAELESAAWDYLERLEER